MIRKLLMVTMLCIGTKLSAQEFKTYKELPQLTIDYKTQNCGAEPNVIYEMHFLRLTNKTDKEIVARFKIEYYFDGNCTTCHNDEYYFSYTIPANSSVTTNCDQLQEQFGSLGIISKYLNRDFGADLDKFELTNISVQ